MTFAFIFAALILGAGISCDRPAEPPPARPTVPAGTGILRGSVTFRGTPPVPAVIGGDCCPGSAPVLDESISVSPGGAMKNVVVWIQDGPNLDIGPMPERVLAQKGCDYVPHVLALRTGQTLVVTSHDPTIHNVHIEAELNPSQNFSESDGETHAVHFDRPERIRFKCDVHPWMTAYACVFDHPCFAVTGSDGTFEIDHLPPGKYTLKAWQEKLGEKSMQVTVSGDKPADVKLEFSGE